MKAAIHIIYGNEEVISIGETGKPIPKANEVLVKVHAATVNRTDCAILTAKPFIMRFVTGLFKPRKHITGTDFAGVVEATGPQVSRFKAGDKVWGFYDNCLQSHAQYLAFPEDKGISIMPAGITFEQAAASIEGAHYAINFLNKVSLKPGQKVLVNGASGAIGSAMVQLVKYYGATVSAVCSTKNTDLVKSLGADRVIDFTREDFTKDHESYDFVFDTVGKSTFGRCKPILNPGGIYISSELGPYVQNLFLALLTPIFGGKKVAFPVPLNISASLDFIKKLTEEGKFKPLIDRVYPLEEIREAFRYVASGQKTGNVVIGIK